MLDQSLTKPEGSRPVPTGPIPAAFRDIAHVLLRLASRHRAEIDRVYLMLGQDIEPSPKVMLMGLQDSLYKLEEAAALIAGLAGHETTVRDLRSVNAALTHWRALREHPDASRLIDSALLGN